jgi:hypothetical protein
LMEPPLHRPRQPRSAEAVHKMLSTHTGKRDIGMAWTPRRISSANSSGRKCPFSSCLLADRGGLCLGNDEHAGRMGARGADGANS